MASQRPARATHSSTTTIRGESNPYLPLATNEDVTSNGIRLMNEVPNPLDCTPSKSFLERVEHSQHLLLVASFLAAISGAFALWAASLLWFSFGNITGGIISIVANCPSGKACAVGAIQFTMGVIGAIAGVVGVTYHPFKRDSSGTAVYHLYEDSRWSARRLKRNEDLVATLRQHDAADPARIVFHRRDGSSTHVVGGNTGYAAAIHDDDTGTYANVAHSKGDTNEWASLAFDQLQQAGADSLCMGMIDPDNGEDVAVVRLQPATNGDYGGLDTDAFNGHGFRKRDSQRSTGIICQEVCTVVSGPKAACLNAEGGCSYVNGGCNPNLDQPARACDGVICGEERQCD
ncbi:uncharacterized protein PAN0_008c3658 [Moesziomyces antarcticus]|uniref:Uncharacterized protein n=2 Tax=Pseudozyma antarctica TaxID=84753 RepID=A0A5C3FSK3_PSEA2|nr:uncharacterized protein PAN0_008c3658 [Moesziomyces antarcticus]GAK65441.1 conserved hypothetical protein [Moesziomyces antarcticus]SPO46451.1 uncharacterized protein PSANT_04137 [Moesziomyces antarcticus]